MNETKKFTDRLRRLARNDKLLEVGRKAVETSLINLRDNRVSILGRGNGLVVRERNGNLSGVVRMEIANAVRTALLAIADELDLE